VLVPLVVWFATIAFNSFKEFWTSFVNPVRYSNCVFVIVLLVDNTNEAFILIFPLKICSGVKVDYHLKLVMFH
jgi:hypothetical protein